MISKRKPPDRNADPQSPPTPQPKPKRGRPEKRGKIDDTPRNVARSFFGIRSTKFTKKQGESE